MGWRRGGRLDSEQIEASVRSRIRAIHVMHALQHLQCFRHNTLSVYDHAVFTRCVHTVSYHAESEQTGAGPERRYLAITLSCTPCLRLSCALLLLGECLWAYGVGRGLGFYLPGLALVLAWLAPCQTGTCVILAKVTILVLACPRLSPTNPSNSAT